MAMHHRALGVLCTVGLLWCQVVARNQAPPANDWRALDAEVTDLYVKGDLRQAIVVAEAALRVAAAPAETGRSLDRLGFLLFTSGDLTKGEEYLRQSLEVREKAFGPDSLDYAESANDLAMLLRDRRRTDDARALAARSVAIRLRLLGPESLLLAESLNTKATVLGLAGDYGTAVPLFERAMAIHELRSAPERANEEYGTLCVNLAGTYQRLGKYGAAEAAFAKGLAALRIKPGSNHPAYAVSVLAYAALVVDLGRYADAERMYDDAGQLLKTSLTEAHPIYATFLNNRGLLFQTIGNFSAAEADYQRSLALKRKLSAPPLSVASTLRNLANLTYRRNRQEGERLLAEAVDTYAKLPSPPPFDYTSVLLGRARAQRDRGALVEARETTERGLTVARQGLGTQHPLYAAAVRDLGLVYAASGDNENAERHLREAMVIAESVHGPIHPDLTGFLESLGGFYAKRGDYAAAEPLYRRSVDIRDRFLSDILEIGSERFKATSMATALDPIATLIAFQARAAGQVPGARALAFEVVTERKGRVLDQIRTWRQRLRENTTEPVQRQLSEWQAVLECRTSLTLALGYRDLKPGIVGSCGLDGTDLAGRYERLLSDLRTARTDAVAMEAVRAVGVLAERGDALEASLNRETGSPSARRKRTSVEDIRRNLGGEELLVEFVSYADAREDEGARRYGAFLLDQKGTLDWVDLGPAGPIDLAIRDLLSAANDWSVSVRNHETAAARSSELTARDTLSDLSARIWNPLKPLIDARADVRHLRIAPDAALNLVPFEALSDGRQLIERFAIGYLPAGRDLAAEEPAESAPTAPIVVVSPGANARRDRGGAAPPAFRATTLSRLGAASAEAADFRRLVPSSELYSSGNATERRVKSVRGPLLLHIAGHGIIGGAEDCQERPCASDGLEPSANAMALSAIVLEEAYGRGSGSSEDGMLTPLELQNVNLRGTHMLVLSQCQMASGVTSVGEGVYGMRRAAAIAGARTFVAPLWNVEDGVQRLLMRHFYRGLAAGLTRSEALRRAKLEVRQMPATASFLYWAPVILSGADSPLPPSLFNRPQAADAPRQQ